MTLKEEINKVLMDFIQGKLEVKDYQEYLTLERIAVILNKYEESNII
jgi:hypothetical protein